MDMSPERIDPVSGNDIPIGATAENVRDDIPAQLSEGEYVVPADVVNYYGVKFFEDLRSEAKEGFQEMAETGRIGGEPIETPMDDLPFDVSELRVEDDVSGYSDGGLGSSNIYGQVGGFTPPRAQTPDPTYSYTPGQTVNVAAPTVAAPEVAAPSVASQGASRRGPIITQRQMINPATGHIVYVKGYNTPGSTSISKVNTGEDAFKPGFQAVDLNGRPIDMSQLAGYEMLSSDDPRYQKMTFGEGDKAFSIPHPMAGVGQRAQRQVFNPYAPENIYRGSYERDDFAGFDRVKNMDKLSDADLFQAIDERFALGEYEGQKAGREGAFGGLFSAGETNRMIDQLERRIVAANDAQDQNTAQALRQQLLRLQLHLGESGLDLDFDGRADSFGEKVVGGYNPFGVSAFGADATILPDAAAQARRERLRDIRDDMSFGATDLGLSEADQYRTAGASAALRDAAARRDPARAALARQQAEAARERARELREEREARRAAGQMTAEEQQRETSFGDAAQYMNQGGMVRSGYNGGGMAVPPEQARKARVADIQAARASGAKIGFDEGGLMAPIPSRRPVQEDKLSYSELDDLVPMFDRPVKQMYQDAKEYTMDKSYDHLPADMRDDWKHGIIRQLNERERRHLDNIRAVNERIEAGSLEGRGFDQGGLASTSYQDYKTQRREARRARQRAAYQRSGYKDGALASDPLPGLRLPSQPLGRQLGDRTGLVETSFRTYPKFSDWLLTNEGAAFRESIADLPDDDHQRAMFAKEAELRTQNAASELVGRPIEATGRIVGDVLGKAGSAAGEALLPVGRGIYDFMRSAPETASGLANVAGMGYDAIADAAAKAGMSVGDFIRRTSTPPENAPVRPNFEGLGAALAQPVTAVQNRLQAAEERRQRAQDYQDAYRADNQAFRDAALDARIADYQAGLAAQSPEVAELRRTNPEAYRDFVEVQGARARNMAQANFEDDMRARFADAPEPRQAGTADYGTIDRYGVPAESASLRRGAAPEIPAQGSAEYMRGYMDGLRAARTGSSMDSATAGLARGTAEPAKPAPRRPSLMELAAQQNPGQMSTSGLGLDDTAARAAMNRTNELAAKLMQQDEELRQEFFSNYADLVDTSRERMSGEMPSGTRMNPGYQGLMSAEDVRGFQEGGLGAKLRDAAMTSIIEGREEKPEYITDPRYDELEQRLVENDMAKLRILLQADYDFINTPLGQRMLNSLRPRSVEELYRLMDAQEVVARGEYAEGTPAPEVSVVGPGDGLMTGEPQQAQRATNWSTRAVEEARARGESLGSVRGSSATYASSDRNIGIDAGDAAQRARDAGIFTVLGRNRNVGNQSGGGSYENAGKPTVDVRAAYTPADPGNPEGASAEEYAAAKEMVDSHQLGQLDPASIRALINTLNEQREQQSRADRFGEASLAMAAGGSVRRPDTMDSEAEEVADYTIEMTERGPKVTGPNIDSYYEGMSKEDLNQFADTIRTMGYSPSEYAAHRDAIYSRLSKMYGGGLMKK